MHTYNHACFEKEKVFAFDMIKQNGLCVHAVLLLYLS